jgi:hypothetical protein
MDAQDDEASAPKPDGADAAKPRRGRPPKDRQPEPLTGADGAATQWIRAKRHFHVAVTDMPGVDPATTSRKMKPGESVEVFAKTARRLIASEFADAV